MDLRSSYFRKWLINIGDKFVVLDAKDHIRFFKESSKINESNLIPSP
jgi:hypothetical protein